jgi:LacI family transcriptional regulator
MQKASPLLLIEHASNCRHIASIAIDHARAGAKVVEFIHERQLGGPLGFVGYRTMPESEKLLSGIDNAMAELGKPPVSSGPFCCLLDAYRPLAVPEDGAAAADALVASPAGRPQVIVTCHDGLAAAVILGLQKHGVAVPADCRVIGYGDNPMICGLVSPPLTTLRIPMYGVGKRAGELLLGLLDGSLAESDRRELRAPRVVVRDSC